MSELNNLSILITGGGSGIGSGTAQYFVERGAMVTICGRRSDRVDAVATALGSACKAGTGDVTQA